jgi:hypothetical protein
LAEAAPGGRHAAAHPTASARRRTHPNVRTVTLKNEPGGHRWAVPARSPEARLAINA